MAPHRTDKRIAFYLYNMPTPTIYLVCLHPHLSASLFSFRREGLHL